MTTLNVRNAEQKVLFEQEIRGQISDGYWENARPFDHHRPWSKCQVVVDPDNIGRDFYAMKNNYGLNSKNLLDCVGDRMLTYVNMLKLLPTLADFEGHLPESLSVYKLYVERGERNDSSWAIEKVCNWWDAGLTAEIVKEAELHQHYTMKDLRKDLADLKKAFKIKR